LFLLGVLQAGLTARSSSLDAIGVTLLRTVTTNVDGTGIRVAQPEADSGASPPDFEVNPADIAVQQPAGLFSYITSSGTTNNFPNFLGSDSPHADEVASNFYGLPFGIATNLAHVDNYDANYFIQVSEQIIGFSTNYTVTLPSSNIDDSVVNQSFIFDGPTVPEQQAVDSAYDNYAARYNTLFVSAAGNAGPVGPPATSYNGIGVGDYGGGSSFGPTLDNGRAKPDITAPENYSSFFEFFNSRSQRCGGVVDAGRFAWRWWQRYQFPGRHSHGQGAAPQWRHQASGLDKQSPLTARPALWSGCPQCFQFLQATHRRQARFHCRHRCSPG
jgi:hypothetical protein